MDFFIINGTLVVLIILLLIPLSWFWPPDSPWAPWWKTSKITARAICRLGKVTKKDIVYDLGCGDAEALLIATKEFGAQGVGIDIDPFRFVVATIRAKLSGKKLKIIHGSFFDQDISKASVIFVYLIPKTLNRLLPKMKKELKKGTRIVSYRYEMNLPLKKYDKKNDIRLYVI